jgi:hypothetical protein
VPDAMALTKYAEGLKQREGINLFTLLQELEECKILEGE